LWEHIELYSSIYRLKFNLSTLKYIGYYGRISIVYIWSLKESALKSGISLTPHMVKEASKPYVNSPYSLWLIKYRKLSPQGPRYNLITPLENGGPYFIRNSRKKGVKKILRGSLLRRTT